MFEAAELGDRIQIEKSVSEIQKDIFAIEKGISNILKASSGVCQEFCVNLKLKARRSRELMVFWVSGKKGPVKSQ